MYRTPFEESKYRIGRICQSVLLMAHVGAILHKFTSKVLDVVLGRWHYGQLRFWTACAGISKWEKANQYPNW